MFYTEAVTYIVYLSGGSFIRQAWNQFGVSFFELTLTSCTCIIWFYFGLTVTFSDIYSINFWFSCTHITLGWSLFTCVWFLWGGFIIACMIFFSCTLILYLWHVLWFLSTVGFIIRPNFLFLIYLHVQFTNHWFRIKAYLVYYHRHTN